MRAMVKLFKVSVSFLGIIHILTNISRNKGNQAVKLRQLIEYKIRDAFLKNPTLKVVEKLVPKLYKNSKSCMSLDQ